jgi:hypothetical protein
MSAMNKNDHEAQDLLRRIDLYNQELIAQEKLKNFSANSPNKNVVLGLGLQRLIEIGISLLIVLGGANAPRLLQSPSASVVPSASVPTVVVPSLK